MSGQLPAAEQVAAPLPPWRSPTLTAFGTAAAVGQVPMPMLPAHGGSPAGARIVRPKAGLGAGVAAAACSARSAAGMSRRLRTAPVAPSTTYARPASTRQFTGVAATQSGLAPYGTSTPSAVTSRSGTPSGAPIV